MIEDELTVNVDFELEEKNWTLYLIDEIFGDDFDVTNDFEYAIAVLLGYGIDDGFDIEDGLEEVANTLGYELIEK